MSSMRDLTFYAHAIEEIEKWSKKQKLLPKDLTRPFIGTFFLGCEKNVEKTKMVLENYFYARQSVPEFFTERDPLLRENIQSWRHSCFVPLSGKQNGCLVFLGTSLDSEHYNFILFIKQMFMCFDLLIKNNEWGNGDRIVILSYDKIKYENLSTLTVYIARKMAECERDKFLPGKLRTIHNVHIPPFMNKIHERFKPFLTPEDEKSILCHQSLHSLHRYVDPEILPLEFGGRAGTLKNISEKWFNILKDHRSFFIEEEEKRMREARGHFPGSVMQLK